MVFQYFTIAPMRDLGLRAGLKAAVRADTLSILAFQLGLFAGMFVYQELIYADPLPRTSANYWMFMQLSMILGFFTAYPVNAWLIRIGWKQRMEPRRRPGFPSLSRSNQGVQMGEHAARRSPAC